MSFPKKAFVFPNNRISEARICCQCWLKKISRKRKPKQQKKLPDNVFLLSPRSHGKIELIWTRKKFRPKKSLTSLLHAALQLLVCYCTVPGKCKLTVPRNSNDSTRSSILETRKFRVSRFESRASSFESRTSSFESRTSSFETRNKGFFARLIFHAFYQTKTEGTPSTYHVLRGTAMAVISVALKTRQNQKVFPLMKSHQWHYYSLLASSLSYGCITSP